MEGIVEGGPYTRVKKLRVRFDDFGEYGLHVLVSFLLDVPGVEAENTVRQRILPAPIVSLCQRHIAGRVRAEGYTRQKTHIVVVAMHDVSSA